MANYKKGKYNHAFDIAFEVISNNDGEHVTADELFEGLMYRVATLAGNKEELIEACGLPFDTYET
jgi:hypothetical protein